MKLIMNIFIVLLPLFLSCKKSTDVKNPTIPPVIDPVESGIDGDPDIGDLSVPGTFYDKFEGSSIDENKWERLTQLWGQPTNPVHQHGGVIKENVYTREGYAVMRSLGDKYTGPLKGLNGRGTRLGGVLQSKQRFASGRYEIKMRILQLPDQGVVSAAWTFWYKQITEASHPEAYQRALLAGNIPQNNKITLNHEIDIEVKGANLGNPIFTNWVGEQEGEHDSKPVSLKVGLNDGKFHVYRWDWHTGGNGASPKVEYYIDDKLVRISTTKVPYVASYLSIGNWFAWWAGNDSGTYKAPNFDTSEMFVDWVKFTPFNQSGDELIN